MEVVRRGRCGKTEGGAHVSLGVLQNIQNKEKGGHLSETETSAIPGILTPVLSAQCSGGDRSFQTPL